MSSYAVTYCRAIRSRSAASAIASLSVAVGGGVHVVPGGAPETAGIGGGDRGENIRRVRPIEAIEHTGERRAQGGVFSLGGRRQRR